ncbi:MAG: DUF1801 domain-containing protein [Calditrichaeota bacterium]|nr:DUF1801 domain-containing protein [Calditrichota bacterium]MBT7618639.1 DUF1801 domain-containing protein [Calditrichota bacterium]MBT7789278.1 DUF1801 domain-containing protein [Calditrichota bacterium]
MAQSKAVTVKEYIEELPEDRREIISTIRDVILKNLPIGYVETMNWGMISYEIPLSDYPDTYNKQPLSFAGLASQKNHISFYSMCTYQDTDLMDWLKMEYEKAGKKLTMGKSCIRFKKIEEFPLEVIGKLIGKISPQEFIENYEKSRKR